MKLIKKIIVLPLVLMFSLLVLLIGVLMIPLGILDRLVLVINQKSPLIEIQKILQERRK
jgi:hypothetical protein